MLLHARDLTVRYGQRTALSDFALQLEPGEVRALIRRSHSPDHEEQR